MHALIAHDAEGNIKVVDLGSTHGTFLDSKKLEKDVPHKLVAGSTLTFGDPAPYYILEMGGSSAAEPPPAKTGEKRKATDEVPQEREERDAAYYERKKQWKKEARKRKWEQKNKDRKKAEANSAMGMQAVENERVAAMIG